MVTVRFHALADRPTSVTCDGKPVGFEWCGKTRVCTVEPVAVSAAGATLLAR